ncbi:MAG: prepilin-type N-terminal cleavage/methylation domain-containing protein [Patescibacteria group bacterium]|jgi:type II secretion system protein G
MRKEKGFTLIELLVVISIIGILVGLSIFGLQSARESSRDASRKTDLELIRSGIEIYRADCGSYPTTLSSPLAGTESTGNTCLTTTTYIAEIPEDPLPDRSYYYSSDGVTYELCAALEGEGTDTCTGSCGETCNYQVTNP